MVLSDLQRPGDAEASAEGCHGRLADVVTGQFQRAFAPDSGLRIPSASSGQALGEGDEAIQLFEDPQEKLGALDALEAAEVLVMLVEAPDDQLHRVVRGGNQIALDPIHQRRPVPLQKVKACPEPVEGMTAAPGVSCT